jgi:alanine racemase
MLQRTIAEIDLNAIKSNIAAIREKVGRDKKVLLAIKSDGYGHGAIQVARAVEDAELVDVLGVALPDEGIELRESGIQLPILIMGLILPHKEIIETLLDYDMCQTVADTHLAEEISKVARMRKKEVNLHLKIDTGMGRIGCNPEDTIEFARYITKLDYILLEGVFSHFPISDEPDSDFTRQQIADFKNIIDELTAANIPIRYKHIANSAAILNYDESTFNMVRPGIMAYGYMPSNTCKKTIPLIPAMTLKSCIIFLKRVKKGTALSYGLTYVTKRDTNIATIPIGYGDGYSRFLSNRGSVLINGKLYPVSGRVCMDQILVDLGEDSYEIGEEVILFGKEKVTVETIADWIGTIPYEITCSISKRVPRVFLS